MSARPKYDILSVGLLSQEHGVLSLAKCHVFEHHSTEWPELNYRAFRVECSHDDGKESVIFMASSISDKAQWMADFSQVSGWVGHMTVM